jgi:hypothetical protein
MALVLCQQCFTWVEPLAEQCPQCDYPIDLRGSDLTLEELAATIGPLVSRFGPVRISRIELPDRGMLYETNCGLFFLPESVERVRLVPANRFPHSPASAIWRALRAPLRIFRNSVLLRGSGASGSSMRVEVTRQDSPVLASEDSERLPRLLMDNPGAFFFPRRSIRALRRTFAGWALVRPNNLVLRVKPLGDRASFHKRMTRFADEVHEAVFR